jgi:hypothetical protein
MILLEPFAILDGYLLLRIEVALVTRERYYYMRGCGLPEICNPLLGILEGFPVGHVKNTDGRRGVSVIDRSHTPVFFLPGRVPDLKLDSRARGRQIHHSCHELGRDCGLRVLLEDVFGESLQYGGLANVRISNEHNFISFSHFNNYNISEN